MKLTIMVLGTLAVIVTAVALSLAWHNWWIGGLLIGAYFLARLYDWRRSRERSGDKSEH